MSMATSRLHRANWHSSQEFVQDVDKEKTRERRPSVNLERVLRASQILLNAKTQYGKNPLFCLKKLVSHGKSLVTSIVIMGLSWKGIVRFAGHCFPLHRLAKAVDTTTCQGRKYG